MKWMKNTMKCVILQAISLVIDITQMEIVFQLKSAKNWDSKTKYIIAIELHFSHKFPIFERALLKEYLNFSDFLMRI